MTAPPAPADFLPASPDSLGRALDALGVPVTKHTHAPLMTVEDSKALRGDLPGGHCKNLFLKDKKGVLWLVVSLEDARLDMKELKKTIGAAHLSFGKPELLADVLGVTPGSVTPFALMSDTAARVRVVLDRAMLARDPINYHPLINTRTWAIGADDLVRFIRWTGHEPAILDL